MRSAKQHLFFVYSLCMQSLFVAALLHSRFDPVSEQRRCERQRHAPELRNKRYSTSCNPTPGHRNKVVHKPHSLGHMGDKSAYPFFLGTATSAYQIEGAASEGGRGLSIWDTWTRKGKAARGDTGDVAVDFYHRYPEDIKLLQSLGIKHFRLSISWPRVMPKGRGEVNQEGLEFYVRVIDALLAAGIEPHVTLYHWDLPQALYDEYKGWIDTSVQDDFAQYAAVVFQALGSRVTFWTTFNEPWTFCYLGYSYGVHPPNRGTGQEEGGDSMTEPYLCAYNVVLAHAKAVRKFRDIVPHGKISINLNIDWAEPFDPNNPADVAAADRHIDFGLNIYADPLYFGEFPVTVRERVACIPPFTAQEKSLLLAGKPDYFALNHYSSNYIRDNPDARPPIGAEETKIGIDGKLIGPIADSPWLAVVPWGIRKILNYVSQRYGAPEIYITENGCDVPNEDAISLPDVLHDSFRVEYYKGYLENVNLAVQDGVEVKAYFAWSLLDNFEWADGYAKRFGIVYVDYKDGLRRYPKDSSRWLAKAFGLQQVLEGQR